jgi:hypothetical protein
MFARAIEKLRFFWFEGPSEPAVTILRRLWLLILLKEFIFVWWPGFSLMFEPGAPYRDSEYTGAPAWWNALSSLSGFELRGALLVLLCAILWSARMRWFRSAGLVVLYLFICLQDISPHIFYSQHRILVLFGLCLIVGGRPSLRFIQLSVSQIYLYAFLSKIVEPEWRAGDAVFYVSQMEMSMTDLSRYLLSHLEIPLWVFRALTWFTLAVEGFAWWALWLRPTRKAALILTAVLHVGLYLFMTVLTFQETMILGLCSFINWHLTREPSKLL